MKRNVFRLDTSVTWNVYCHATSSLVAARGFPADAFEMSKSSSRQCQSTPVSTAGSRADRVQRQPIVAQGPHSMKNLRAVLCPCLLTLLNAMTIGRKPAIVYTIAGKARGSTHSRQPSSPLTLPLSFVCLRLIRFIFFRQRFWRRCRNTG